MKPRFPIGLTFTKKRFPKAKELTTYKIADILTTSNNSGVVVRIEYVISHDFAKQPINEFVCDTTIARSLESAVLAIYNS